MRRSLFPALLLALPFAAAAQNTDPNLARNMAATCANCHGVSGKTQAGMPAISGQSRENLLRVLKEFKDGKRPATIMHQISKGYTDEQLDMIAAYFAAQK